MTLLALLCRRWYCLGVALPPRPLGGHQLLLCHLQLCLTALPYQPSWQHLARHSSSSSRTVLLLLPPARQRLLCSQAWFLLSSRQPHPKALTGLLGCNTVRPLPPQRSSRRQRQSSPLRRSLLLPQVLLPATTSSSRLPLALGSPCLRARQQQAHPFKVA